MSSFVLSLGGSLVVPEEIDAEFLKEFSRLILKHAKTGKKFIIIVGGGKTARRYQTAAKEIADACAEDLDWLGIHATRINAHLLRTIFREYAYPKVVKNPTEKIKTEKPIIIASGWKPGCSTDYDAVLLARNFGIKTVVNLTNIDFVCTKDPKIYKDAKPIKKIGWKDFRKLVGDEWDPGLNVPFDPVASRKAEKAKMRVVILNGKNLENLDSFLDGRGFEGTEIK